MSKIAVMFSGQGAQKIGMGKSLYDNVPASKEIFEKAQKLIPNIIELCFEGSQEDLNKTINTQGAMFTVDMAAYVAFVSRGFKADFGVGFSVGEYPALCASGVLGFEDALNLIKNRSAWMQQEAESHKGGMVAVLGKSADEVLELTKNFEGLIPVNYNCPGQTVVAGDLNVIEEFMPYCKENKIKCKKLPVNGAFHSVHMKAVSVKIGEYIKDITFNNPQFVLYANKTGKPYGQDIKQVLSEQTSSPVLFENSIRDIMQKGCNTFVEVGVGSTLAGFVKRIDKSLKIFNIEDEDTLINICTQLKE